MLRATVIKPVVFDLFIVWRPFTCCRAARTVGSTSRNLSTILMSGDYFALGLHVEISEAVVSLQKYDQRGAFGLS